MLGRRVGGWQRLRDEQPPELDRLDAWSRRHLDALAELEARAPAAGSGNTLLHFDVRADNILLAPGRVWVFVLAQACNSDAWHEVPGPAPRGTMQGGPPPEDGDARFPACRSVS